MEYIVAPINTDNIAIKEAVLAPKSYSLHICGILSKPTKAKGVMAKILVPLLFQIYNCIYNS